MTECRHFPPPGTVNDVADVSAAMVECTTSRKGSNASAISVLVSCAAAANFAGRSTRAWRFASVYFVLLEESFLFGQR